MRSEAKWVLAVVAAGLLGGCQQGSMARVDAPPSASDGDGPACTRGLQSGRVSILVSYDQGSGAPSVAVDECRVKRGTVITWTTMRGETRPFTIFYKGEALGEGRGGVQGQRYRFMVVARDVELTTTFTYGVRANGHVLDPAIIVER